MSRDPLGSGDVSPRLRDERVIAEAVRRVKLEGKNDPAFVPPADDASAMLAGRHFVLQPTVPPIRPDDAQAVLADRIFGQDRRTAIGTPSNVPWTLVQRDAGGAFSAGMVQTTAMRGTIAVSPSVNDWELFQPDGLTSLLRNPTGTPDLDIVSGHLRFIPDAGQIVGGPVSLSMRNAADTDDNLLIADNGDVTVLGGFGCNGASPQPSVAVGPPTVAPGGTMAGISGSAGGTYTGVEQALINALVNEVEAHAEMINIILPAFLSLRTQFEAMRAALIANGILT